MTLFNIWYFQLSRRELRCLFWRRRRRTTRNANAERGLISWQASLVFLILMEGVNDEYGQPSRCLARQNGDHGRDASIQHVTGRRQGLERGRGGRTRDEGPASASPGLGEPAATAPGRSSRRVEIAPFLRHFTNGLGWARRWS